MGKPGIGAPSPVYSVPLLKFRSSTPLMELEKRVRDFPTPNKDIEGFSKRYNLRHLVYYEEHDSPLDAIRREKQIKEWKRIWKDELVESINPTWRDLSEG